MIQDINNIFKKEEKEKAIKKRYGKDVTISICYSFIGDEFKSMDDLISYSLNCVSKNGCKYVITENLSNGSTRSVDLEYGYNKKNTFSRFVDAEISMIDKIAEE